MVKEYADKQGVTEQLKAENLYEWIGRMNNIYRRLRCLLIVDLKVGKFSYSDAGQMNMYLNYAKEHWTLPDENPPIGLILCAEKGVGEAHYALAGLPNTVLASEYKMQLPDEKRLADELVRTQAVLEEGYRRR